MAIPIANVYYLICYAWNHLESRDLVPMGSDLGDRIESLFAHVLDAGLTRLLRQGLDRGYLGQEDDIAGIRGKLLVGSTLERMLLPRGRTACWIDEFTSDVPHNRIVKAAIRQLIAMDTVDLGLRAALRRHRERLYEVADIVLDPAAFRPIQLHGNIARYRFLLDICALLSRRLEELV